MMGRTALFAVPKNNQNRETGFLENNFLLVLKPFKPGLKSRVTYYCKEKTWNGHSKCMFVCGKKNVPLMPQSSGDAL